MRKRFAAMAAVVVALLAACSAAGSTPGSSSSGTAGGAPVAFSGFIGSPGAIEQSQAAVDAFNKANPAYNMTYVQGQANQAPYQQLLAMYASGNVPSVFVLDSGDVPKLADKLVDLSNEPFAKNLYPWAKEPGTVDGKLVAVPQGATGVGFVYNRKLIEDAIGGSFDPSTIKTNTDLAALFAKIQAAGKAPIIVSPVNWSLGAHFLGKFYDAQGDQAARKTFISDLKAGKADVANNKVFNGLMDTFDLMLKYNVNKAAPIAGTVDTDAKAFADGKAAFWFMGDFQWSTLASYNVSPDGSNYGLMPVPVDNDPADPYNQQLQVTSAFMLAVDKSVSTPDQQKGALAYIDWYANSKAGQDYAVNQLGSVSAFSNVTVEPNNPLGRSTLAAMSSGKTYTPTASLPADHWNILGDDMVKYIAGKLDRVGFAAAITTYWKSQK